MALDANTGAVITQQYAEELARNFDAKFPSEITSSFMGKNNVQDILNQEGCIGLRIYNGYDDVEKVIKLVLVGVDSNEADLLAGGKIYDQMVVCPTYCPIDALYVKK